MARFAFLLGTFLAVAGTLLAAEVSGKWTASFDTQIGVQNYTYEFKVDGEKLTGTAESQFGKTAISEGSVKGDEITFVENLDFNGQQIRIVYKGKIAGDEIRFNRKVGDIASEDLVAKRTK